MHTQEALNASDMGVVDLNGRPTLSIPNALSIVQAIYLDMDGRPSGPSLFEHAMAPTPDLHQQILEIPIWPAVNKDAIHGNASIHWLGDQAMERMAVDKGLADFSEWLRTNDWQPTPENGDTMHPYAEINGGLAVVRDIEGERDEVPNWQAIINKYGGADDPVVQGFFKQVEESVRVDVAETFNYISGIARIGMLFSDNPMLSELTNQLDKFLMSRGYIPDKSRVAVIETKSPGH